MRIVENLDLTNYNSYRLTARCARAFFPDTEEDVREVYRIKPGKRKILIGSGHNIILCREWYEHDFVIFNGNFDRISISETVLEAEAGAFTKTMSEVALNHRLSGLEMFYDIPSSLGGAVVMNAGAGGEEIKDLLVNVRYLDLNDLTIHEIDASEVGFTYRNSLFQQDASKLILRARLQLAPSESSAIRAKMETIKAARWAKQPRDLPNAGSVFKRPKGMFVGPMIEKLGMKGLQVGGARISMKHGGFIVCSPGASGSDIIKLVSIVQERVHAAYGVDLEIEQRLII